MEVLGRNEKIKSTEDVVGKRGAKREREERGKGG